MPKIRAVVEGIGRNRRVRLFAGLTAFVFLACIEIGCGGQNEHAGRPTVVVSIPPLAYFAERIAGPDLHISTLVPPGTDPHHFEPAMLQLLDLNRAAIYLEMGHPRLEFETMLRKRHFEDYPNLEVLRLTDSLPLTVEDPHAWTSPRLAKKMAQTIAERLTSLSPANSEFEIRLETLLTEIDALDRKFRQWSNQPGATRAFFSHHDAWGYFARDYDLTQTALLVDHAEPSAARLARVIAKGRRENVRVVLVQPGFSEESARTVAEEIGAQVVTVDPLGSDWLAEMNQLADALIAADAIVQSESNPGQSKEQRP